VFDDRDRVPSISRPTLGVGFYGKRQPVGSGNGSLLAVLDANFFCKPWPIGHRRRDLLDQIGGVFEAVLLGDGEQVGAREVVTFAVDAHLVAVGPTAGGVV